MRSELKHRIPNLTLGTKKSQYHFSYFFTTFTLFLHCIAVLILQVMDYLVLRYIYIYIYIHVSESGTNLNEVF